MAMMASLVATGLLSLGVGAGTPPVIRAASCPLRRPSRARVRSAARLTLRCCAPSHSNPTTGGLPPWAPMSIEELIELGKEDVRESNEAAAAAMRGAVAGLLLRSLRGLFDDVRKLKSGYDIQEFHIGLPVGAVMAGVAVHHLWKAAPSAFVDFVLHYAFYRLCVMAADVRRRGFAPDIIIRLKLFITFAMLIKGLVDQVAFHDYLTRFALFAIYSFSVIWEVNGLKKFARYMLPDILDSFKSPQGRRELRDTLLEIDFGIDEDE